MEDAGRDATTVAVIVNPDAGSTILSLANRMHVWAIDTPANRTAAEAIWRQGDRKDLSMTVFQFDNVPPDEIVVRVLDAIELHHGEASEEVPWSRLEVYGAEATPMLLDVLREYGFASHQETGGGLIAWR